MGYNIARYCFYLAISAPPSIPRFLLPSAIRQWPAAAPDEQRKRSSAPSAPLLFTDNHCPLNCRLKCLLGRVPILELPHAQQRIDRSKSIH